MVCRAVNEGPGCIYNFNICIFLKSSYIRMAFRPIVSSLIILFLTLSMIEVGRFLLESVLFIIAKLGLCRRDPHYGLYVHSLLVRASITPTSARSLIRATRSNPATILIFLNPSTIHPTAKTADFLVDLSL